MAETSKYPRGKPFQAPPEPDDFPVADREPARRQPAHSSDARLRSRTLWMAVGIVGFVFVVPIAAFTALGVRDVVHPASSPIAAAKKTPADGPRQSAKASQPEEEEEPNAKPPIPREPDQAGLALQTLGSLTAAHLYQTYLNLGLLADAAEKGVYNDADARKMLAMLTALIETVDQQLVKFARGGMEPDDRRKLERVRGLTALLRTQASELRAYWDTPATDKEGKKEHETKFHQAREESWIGVKEMLGIQEDKAPESGGR